MQTMGECEVRKTPIKLKVKGERYSEAWGSAKDKMRIERKFQGWVSFMVLRSKFKENGQKYPDVTGEIPG